MSESGSDAVNHSGNDVRSPGEAQRSNKPGHAPPPTECGEGQSATISAPARRSRYIPFLVIVSVFVVFAILFFAVIRPLLLPLFLAAVVALLAQPWQEKLTRRLKGRDGVAAAILTLAAVLLIIVPLAITVEVAFGQVRQYLSQLDVRPAEADGPKVIQPDNRYVAPIVGWVSRYAEIDEGKVRAWVRQAGEQAEAILYHRTMQFLGSIPGLILSFMLFIVALFFFLKDGRFMVEAWDDLTPLDPKHDKLLRNDFTKVCRGVVWGTILASLAQGLAFGAGLLALDYILGLGLGMWTLVLALAVLAFSTLPFGGSAFVWVPFCVWLFLQQFYVAGIIMSVYCLVVVSQIDFVINIWALKNTARMHPLLAFVSVLGGVEFVGILGIFIGPIVGAVVFSLLRILKNEMVRLNRGADAPVVTVSSVPGEQKGEKIVVVQTA